MQVISLFLFALSALALPTNTTLDPTTFHDLETRKTGHPAWISTGSDKHCKHDPVGYKYTIKGFECFIFQPNTRTGSGTVSIFWGTKENTMRHPLEIYTSSDCSGEPWLEIQKPDTHNGGSCENYEDRTKWGSVKQLDPDDYSGFGR